MPRRDLAERRRGLAADRLGVAAAWVEVAAGRRRGRAGDVAGEDDGLVLGVRVRLRHRREQRLGVGVPRAPVEVAGVGELDDLSHVHDRDAVGDVLDDAQVVRDEDDTEVQLALQLLQQVEDLGLDRDVQRRDRLVGDDQHRVGHQRAGDADALALAAGEGVRVAREMGGVEADQLGDLGDALLDVDRPDPLGAKRLADDVADRHPRRERGERVLEDHVHVAAQATERALAGLRQVDRRLVAGGEDRRSRGRVDGADDRAAERGLAAAGFADQPEHLAAGEVEADVVDGLDVAGDPAERAALDRVVFLQAPDAEDGVGHGLRLPGRRRRRLRGTGSRRRGGPARPRPAAGPPCRRRRPSPPGSAGRSRRPAAC